VYYVPPSVGVSCPTYVATEALHLGISLYGLHGRPVLRLSYPVDVAVSVTGVLQSVAIALPVSVSPPVIVKARAIVGCKAAWPHLGLVCTFLPVSLSVRVLSLLKPCASLWSCMGLLAGTCTAGSYIPSCRRSVTDVLPLWWAALAVSVNRRYAKLPRMAIVVAMLPVLRTCLL
jgi:hypothetical protein